MTGSNQHSVQEAMEVASGHMPPWFHTKYAAPALAEFNGLLEQVQSAQRKVDAYDRARSRVKIEGNTRAEYVLRIEALEEQLEAAQAALRSIESMAGAAGAGETPAMPIAAKAREALYPAEMHPTDLAMLKKQLNEESSPVSGGVGALDAASPEGSSPARERP